MKIAVIDSKSEFETRDFLPELLAELNASGNEIQRFTQNSPDETAFAAAKRLNESSSEVYLIWNAEEFGWNILPLLNPQTATVAVGHADSEIYYAPVRHYRAFLTRVIGTSPEVCVGFVLNCVIEKEKVEWISFDETDDETTEENDQKPLSLVENLQNCFEKAIADAHTAPREISENFPPMQVGWTAQKSWFDRIKERFAN